jgi:hypothetical protein
MEEGIMSNELAVEVEETKKRLVKLSTEHGERNGKLELKKEVLVPADRNMQLALTRLVNDDDEQELARTNGKAFQIKYDLSNDQMFTLCRLAIQIGFYEDTKDLEDYLKVYAKLSDQVKGLTPAKARQLLGGDGDPAGSCSCSCP